MVYETAVKGNLDTLSNIPGEIVSQIEEVIGIKDDSGANPAKKQRKT